MRILEIEGPTSFLPDFFSELYGKYRGYLIFVEKSTNPYELKKSCMRLDENSENKRFCDIDVYTSKDKSIHRKEL